MSVAALIADESQARSVVTWAGRFAAACNTELIIFYVSESSHADDFAVATEECDLQFADAKLSATQRAVEDAVEDIVKTRRARKGRVARHDVSVRKISDPDLLGATLLRLRVESPELFVCGGGPAVKPTKGEAIARQVAAKTSCDSLVLHCDGERSRRAGRIVVGTSEGPHDSEALKLAARTGEVTKGCVSAICVEATIGDRAVEVGERSLRSMLRELGLNESSHLKVKAVLGKDPVAAIAEEASECDLLLIGSNLEPRIPGFLKSLPKATIGVFHRAPRLTLARGKVHLGLALPRLNPNDYADLYEQLQSGSRWNCDFVMMLGLAAAISTLGLLQNSPAVVIGSMLLAPLMTPMIGMGLALNQGNTKLAYSCFRAIGRGFLAALTISALVGWITPGSDLTPEIVSRTAPNILDLLIALLSGVAAAYALARPSVAGTIAGVAIATALVPPTCSAGIALAYGQFPAAIGALFLLIANVLAIILAAAGTFRAMGLRTFTAGVHRGFWVRHVIVGLTLCILAAAIPLVASFMRQVYEGKTAPIALAVTNDTREALLAHIDRKAGVELLFVGRAGVERESDPVDVAIILSSNRPLERSEGDALIQLARETMQNPDLLVKVACVRDGWAPEACEIQDSEELTNQSVNVD